MSVQKLTPILATLFAALLISPVAAQSGTREGDERNRSDSRSYSDSQDNWNDDYEEDSRDRDRQARRSNRQSQQNRDSRDYDSQRDSNRNSGRQSEQNNRKSRNYSVEPVGWVQVAVDYDNDGYYDGVETIYYYDLQQARNQSRQRADDQKRQGRSGSRQANSNRQRSQRQNVRLRGEIVSLESKTMMGDKRDSDSKQQVAELETNSGRTVSVCLGSKDKVDELDLEEGDRITVEGVRAKMDDKEVVLAKRVSAGNDSITNELPRRQQWRRMSGTVRSMHTTDGGDREESHLVVKVSSEDGRTKQVDLGPKDELDDLDLQEGDRIQVLGRQGTIDGETLTIAQIVRANNETIDVRESTEKSLKKSKNRNRNNRNYDRS